MKTLCLVIQLAPRFAPPHLDKCREAVETEADAHADPVTGLRPLENGPDMDPSDLFQQCTLGKGRRIGGGDGLDEASVAPVQVLLPLDGKNLSSCFDACSTTAFYDFKCVRSCDFSSRVVLSSREVSTKAQGPFIAGEGSLSSGDSSLKVGKEEAVTVVKLFRAPVKSFRISPDFHIKREHEAEEAHHTFKVSDHLARRTRKLLHDERSFPEIRDALASEFGEVVATNVQIGVAAFAKTSFLSSTEESLEKIQSRMAASAGLALGPFKASVAAKTADDRETDLKQSSSERLQEYSVIAGGYSGEVRGDPQAVVPFNRDPRRWRAIQFSDIVLVVDLLPAELRQKLEDSKAAWEAANTPRPYSPEPVAPIDVRHLLVRVKKENMGFLQCLVDRFRDTTTWLRELGRLQFRYPDDKTLERLTGSAEAAHKWLRTEQAKRR